MLRICIYVGLLVSIVCIVAYFFYVAVVETSTTAERISGTELNFKKNEWIEIIRQKGSKEAYQLFLAEAPQNIEIDTHTQAHLFGEALYEVDGLDGISICDDSFAFGCYHSFLGSAIYYEGIETLPFFNQACKDKYGSENLPCQHGIGHGVLIYTGYDDLVGALDLCRTITDRPTGGCSSGVFMEYNFHTMESESVVGYSRPLTEDVFAPCSNLDSSYQPSCYLEQVQWWEGIFNRDYKKIGVLCEEIAEEVNRQACFHGVGNYIASFTMHDVQKILHLCTLMPSATGRAECHEGASWLIRGDGSFVDDARLLCDALSEPYRSSCNHKLS